MHQSDPFFEPSAALYERHAPVILGYLLRQLSSREEAEDILLEVFTAVLEKESAPQQNERALRAWLLTIARNKVADYYRRAGRLSRTPLGEDEEQICEPAEREPERIFLRQEAYRQLQKYVQKLTKKQQEVLWLRFVEEMRCGEIAQIIGKSERATRIMLYRILKKLRGFYEYENEQAERGL